MTLARPVIICRTLSELRLWDNPGAEGPLLRRTIAEGSCRNLDPGATVIIVEQARIGSTDYECIRVDAGAECVWAGALGSEQRR